MLLCWIKTAALKTKVLQTLLFSFSFFFLCVCVWKKTDCVHTNAAASIMNPPAVGLHKPITPTLSRAGRIWQTESVFCFSLRRARDWKAYLRSWEERRTILQQALKEASNRLSCLFKFWHFTETDRPTLTRTPSSCPFFILSYFLFSLLQVGRPLS